MQSGDLLFVHGRDCAGRLVRGATGSYWNHVALVVSPAGDLIEAVSAGVRRNRAAAYVALPTALSTTRFAPPQQRRIVALAEARVGEAYSWDAVAAVFVRRLSGGRLHLPASRQCDDCASFVARLLALTDALVAPRPEEWSPRDLAAHYGVRPQ